MPLFFNQVYHYRRIFVHEVQKLIFISIQWSFPFVALELDIRADLLYFCIRFDNEDFLLIDVEIAVAQRPDGTYLGSCLQCLINCIENIACLLDFVIQVLNLFLVIFYATFLCQEPTKVVVLRSLRDGPQILPELIVLKGTRLVILHFMVAALELSVKLCLKLVLLNNSINHVPISILIKQIRQLVKNKHIFRLILILSRSDCL